MEDRLLPSPLVLLHQSIFEGLLDYRLDRYSSRIKRCQNNPGYRSFFRRADNRFDGFGSFTPTQPLTIIRSWITVMLLF